MATPNESAPSAEPAPPPALAPVAPAPAPPSSPWFARAAELLPPVVLGVVGLLFGHHPMLLAGLDKVQRDWGDSRFVNYLLEHGYRWLLRRPGHQSFWDPPFFYPAKGVLAYSESMLGAGPYYWVWRALGFASDTSYQLWFLTLSALNFASVHLLLRRCLKLSPIGSALGAFFFAFANVRINQTMHQALFPHFYSVGCVYALWRLFEPLDGEPVRVGYPRELLRGLGFGTPEEKRKVRWIAVFFACFSLQLYASFYLGWFLAFCLLLAGAVALVLKVSRPPLLRTLARFPGAVVGLGALAAALTAPMVLRYMRASREVGMRSFGEVLTMLPPLRAWFDLGPENWLYRGWHSYFASISMEHEQRLGFGVLTTALFLVGLVLARKRPALRLMSLSALALFALVTFWAPNFIPWKVIYDTVPGAGAVRAISRIGLQLLLPVGIGVAVLWDFLVARKLWWIAAPLCAFAMVEQRNDGFAFSKTLDRRDIQLITRELGPECEAFFYSPVGGTAPLWKYQNDAMMASLASGVPTLNGYSGNAPPGWGLGYIGLPHALADGQLRAQLDAWMSLQHLDPARICWLKVATNDDDNAADVVSMEAPPSVVAGQPFEVSVTVKNIGTRPWSPRTLHRLGTQAPQDNSTWGAVRVELPKDVALGETVTVRFPLRAPAQPGVYPLQWRMVQDNVTWFGQFTPFQQVQVTPPAQP